MFRKLSAPAAILLGLCVIGVLLAAFPRTTAIATPYGYIERDRWTGSAMACSVAHPENFLQSAISTAKNGADLSIAIGTNPGTYRYIDAERRDPPRVCLDLN